MLCCTVDAVMTVACTTYDAPKYCEVSLGKEACMIKERSASCGNALI